MLSGGVCARGSSGRVVLRMAAVLTVLACTLSPAAVVLPARVAHAATPCAANPQPDPAHPDAQHDPNDPEYNPSLHVAGKTWNDDQWYLFGCMPPSAPLAQDPEGASGMSVDQFWKSFGMGRDEILVSYAEGGINWRIDQSCELKDRSYLNKAELPLPQDANGKTKIDLGLQGDPYDLNTAGVSKDVFNVEDYINDKRVTDAVAAYVAGGGKKTPAGGSYLHHLCSTKGIPVDRGGTDITPEDLILAFGHCQVDKNTHLIVGGFPCDQTKHFDNDGNGYANDISGWNFNRDDNDPQTEQSIYGHFTGEASQLVGEANNSFKTAGICPQCRFLPIKAGDEAIDRPDRIAEAVTYAADSGVKVLDFTTAALGLTNDVKAAIEYGYHKGMVMTWASNDFESADHTDGMFYPHVWPGNSITGDHSTRGVNIDCTALPGNPPSCPVWYAGNNTFRSRSSLTSYGPHSLFSVPNNDGSTSTGIPTQAGVAALIASEGLNSKDAGHISSQLDSEEIRQVARSTASYIGNPYSGNVPGACATCFQGIPTGATFNIQYGYGRPNLLKAGQAVDAGHVPPTADIRGPDWYQEVDPTRQPTVHASADLAARRQPGGSYTYQFQYGLGPEPLESDFHTFASGSGNGPASVGADLDLSQIPQSFWSGQYSVDPATRSSIERYDVSIRVQVFAGGDTNTSWKKGEDRRAFHLRHDESERPGFPVRINSSGESSPTMADIEGRGWLDTIMGTADGTVHAIRPDGTEAPGFPVRTDLVPGMDPSYDTNYLSAPAWRDGSLPRPRDGTLSALAVGDLRHDGGLEIVLGSLSGKTYAWDGAGHRLPGFPVLNGNPAFYHMSVPPPDTPYSFEPQNLAGPSPVLADLTGDGHLDIIQGAADNHLYAWEVAGGAVQQVPGWPVCDIFLPVPTDGTCKEPPQAPPFAGIVHTHDSKTVPTPAIADVNGDGVPDVLLGSVDSTWDNGVPAGNMKIYGYLEAFSGKGTQATPSGQLPGWPTRIDGLVQGYGVAQDFVTQGVETPVVYDTPQGPQAVVNANLFLPWRVDLNSHTQLNVFAGTIIPPTGSSNLSIPGPAVQFTTSPSAGNVTGGVTPTPQIFQPGSTATGVVLGITQTPGLGIRVDNTIGGWDPTSGVSLPQFSQYVQGLGFFTAPAIADVTGDGKADVIQAADSSAVMGFDAVSGQPAAGFPKWSGGWTLFTPAVGDLMGTGTVDVAANTREGYLHMWDTPGQTGANHEAWHWHQDDRNTGHYGTDTRPPAAIRDLVVSTSGGKDTLTFTAPGDDWNWGTAAGYQVFRSGQPITQDNIGQATPVSVSQKPQAAGSHEVIDPPHVGAQPFYAVRAIDAAGNIGPVQVLAGTNAALNPNPGGSPVTAAPASSLPNTSGWTAWGLLLALLAGLVVCLGSDALRRRQAG